jgi:hypothetical protein
VFLELYDAVIQSGESILLHDEWREIERVARIFRATRPFSRHSPEWKEKTCVPVSAAIGPETREGYRGGPARIANPLRNAGAHQRGEAH